MNRKTVALLLCATFFIIVKSDAAILTVSQDGKGAYKTVQSAVDAANHGDVISILDNAVYKEQVTIESLKSLTIKSENPFSLKKPVITYCDKKNVGPKNCEEAKDMARITFDRNGALRIINSSDITIDGIIIDGGEAYAFGYESVFSDGGQYKYPLQHGNSALVIFHSGNVIVRNCECQNAYFGIYVKDRNEGGIFAISNPSDLNQAVQPLSGFGKTGNNIFEYNRIHNNSFGIFFESSWDLGNIVRYNLFYENHHPSELFASEVKSLTSDGTNQPGGAILLKDTQKSPVAVYNNTFWHNHLIFAGQWRCGSQHLIFNNIYAEPYQYWSQNVFENSILAADPVFVNRMFNCVYACMTSKPVPVKVEVPDVNTDQVLEKESGVFRARIMNGINEIQSSTIEVTVTLSDGSTVKKTVTGVQCEGNRIGGSNGQAFPEKNEIRWLETKFKSTDPASTDFLVPDWDDSLVNKFILDRGWVQCGVKDIDGTVADLGAISKSGNRA
ncbi:MAG: hypothetical protein GX640_12710, partial [Fibrobacter sp.]|nr:hypothetical protein [Fibrobacter sp.]